jgi:hypothetical protein
MENIEAMVALMEERDAFADGFEVVTTDAKKHDFKDVSDIKAPAVRPSPFVPKSKGIGGGWFGRS